MVNRGNSEMLITRDLLGELSKVSTTTTTTVHNFFDFKSKTNCRKRRSNSPDTPLSSFNIPQQKQRTQEEGNRRQDSSNLTESKFLDAHDTNTHFSLDLKLKAPSFSSPFSPPTTYVSNSYNTQSVCTLDKVKKALERATSRPVRDEKIEVLVLDEAEEEKKGKENGRFVGQEKRSSDDGGGMFVASCPVCLSYVITMKSNPKCPRCNAFVPSPFDVSKKTKIDLNG